MPPPTPPKPSPIVAPTSIGLPSIDSPTDPRQSDRSSHVLLNSSNPTNSARILDSVRTKQRHWYNYLHQVLCSRKGESMGHHELYYAYDLLKSQLAEIQRCLETVKIALDSDVGMTRHELLATQMELMQLHQQLWNLARTREVVQKGTAMGIRNSGFWELSEMRRRSSVAGPVGTDFANWSPTTPGSDSDSDQNPFRTAKSRMADSSQSEDQTGVALPNSSPTPWKPTKQEWIIMLSLSIISLAVALDATILVAVLPRIASALNGSSTDAFWAGTSYLLTNAVSQPIMASISELFGRQQLLLSGLFFFTVGSVICAVAPDFRILFAGRSIQGIGGGGIITMAQVIYSDLVPLRERPKYFALVLGSWSIGSIVGPVVGGAICENTTWRWVFYLNFPFCFIGIVLGLVFVKLKAKSEDTLVQKLGKVDWLGSFLFVAGLTGMLVGLSFGGVSYPWISVETLVPIFAGLACLGGFVVWQISARHPLLPRSIFYCPSIFSAFHSATINGLQLYTALYYWPFYLMSIRLDTPIRAGIDIFPALFFLLPGSILVSALTSRLGRFRWAIWGGWVLSTSACGFAIYTSEHDHIVISAVCLSIFGVGSGMVLTSVNVAIQAISRVEDCAMAASMYAFMRSLGMPLGIVIGGTVFQNAMIGKLEEFGLPTLIAHDSERFIYQLHVMPLDDPKRGPILDSYKYGFRNVWIMVTALSASAIFASLIIKRFDMDKMLAGKFTARRLSLVTSVPQ